VILLAVVGIATTTVVVVRSHSLEKSAPGAVPTCAGETTTGGSVFTGVTPLGGAVVRSGAGQNYPAQSLGLPGGCIVRFRGYCLGEAMTSASTFGKPEARWFILADGKGLVTPAQLFGYNYPPPEMDPSPCSGAQPVPHTIGIANPQATSHAGVVHLYAQADGDVAFVGWVVASALPGPGGPSHGWQQIGEASPEAGGFGLDWDTRMLPIPGPKGAQQVILGAVACYAEYAPGQAQSYALVPVPNGVAPPGPPAGVANQPALSSESKAAAQRTACLRTR
jgi:hypothetical protein